MQARSKGRSSRVAAEPRIEGRPGFRFSLKEFHSRAVGLLAAALLAAACQPLPQVMERDKASALLALPESVGLRVGRVHGAPPALEDRLRRGLEEALHRRGLPASRHEGNRLSFRLSGRVEPDMAADAAAGLVWELRAWDGRLAGRFEQQVADGGALDELADDIAQRVRADRPAEGDPVRLKISVAPISGAAAEAAAPLLRALETALAEAGLDVAPPAAPSHLHVFGSAEIGPVRAGLRELRLGWSVVWSDGREVGRVDQANAVPAAWLEGAWTSLAAAAAEGAASGISDLVFKARMELRPTGGAAGRSRL